MKFTSVLSLSFFCIVLFSCQKQISGDLGTTSGTSSNKVKTYTEDLTYSGTHSVTTFNIGYDASDRIISMISALSPGDKFLYQYNSNNTFTLDLYNSNILNIHEIFFLNSSALLDSTFQFNDTHDTTTEKYLYNSAKQLITLNEFDYTTLTGAVLFNTHHYVYDTNGNDISDTDNSSVTTYDYTTLSGNVYIFPYSFMKPVNLIKTTTINSGGSIVILNHTYTFDSNNRLSTEKQASTDGSIVLIKTYNYY